MLDRPDITQPEAYLTMMDTRYTPWLHIGDLKTKTPGLLMNEKGPYFQQLDQFGQLVD